MCQIISTSLWLFQTHSPVTSHKEILLPQDSSKVSEELPPPPVPKKQRSASQVCFKYINVYCFNVPAWYLSHISMFFFYTPMIKREKGPGTGRWPWGYEFGVRTLHHAQDHSCTGILTA